MTFEIKMTHTFDHPLTEEDHKHLKLSQVITDYITLFVTMGMGSVFLNSHFTSHIAILIMNNKLRLLLMNIVLRSQIRMNSSGIGCHISKRLTLVKSTITIVRKNIVLTLVRKYTNI